VVVREAPTWRTSLRSIGRVVAGARHLDQVEPQCVGRRHHRAARLVEPAEDDLFSVFRLIASSERLRSCGLCASGVPTFW